MASETYNPLLRKTDMYFIIWEFVVHPDRVREFVAAYKADGDWAGLFSRSPGYGGTDLLSSTHDTERFVTIDRWNHADDYIRFQERFGQQYRSLDAQLEGLTLSETKLGTYATAMT
jgi:heme-degrading monooxygenase HmoA